MARRKSTKRTAMIKGLAVPPAAILPVQITGLGQKLIARIPAYVEAERARQKVGHLEGNAIYDHADAAERAAYRRLNDAGEAILNAAEHDAAHHLVDLAAYVVAKDAGEDCQWNADQTWAANVMARLILRAAGVPEEDCSVMGRIVALDRQERTEA